MSKMTDLGQLVHLAAHASYEELLQLERDCKHTHVGDSRRKRALTGYFDRVRHRLLQLLALLHWADADSPVLLLAQRAIGEPVEHVRFVLSPLFITSINLRPTRSFMLVESIEILRN